MRMTTEANLSALVKRYNVCWEVWPEICPGTNHTQVGYQVELFGTNPRVHDLEPSSPDCARIRTALEAIAMDAFSSTQDVHIESYSDGQSIRYSPARGNRPDVTFSVKILHRNGYERPVDENERAFLDKVKRRLRLLGAQERCWHEVENHAGKTIAYAREAA
jgi:hypothetical protein